MELHNLNVILYLIPIAISWLITFGLSLLAFKRKGVPGSLPFAILLLLESEWIGGYIIGLLSPNLDSKIFWENIQYFGTLLSPIMMLLFAHKYTDQKSLNNWRLWVGLSVPALIVIILSFTNPWHNLALLNQRLIQGEPFDIYLYDFGIPVYAVLIYCYLLMFSAMYLLINHFFQQVGIQRRQTGFILAGFIIPVIGSLTIFLDFPFLPQRDISPYYFALANLFIAYGLFKVGIFEIVPIGRNLVVSNMKDGLLIVDVTGHLVDINDSARTLMGLSDLVVNGQLINNLHGKWGEYLQIEPNREANYSKEIQLISNGLPQNYEIVVTRIINNSGQFVGHMIIIRDINERKLLEDERRHGQDLLESRVNERTAELVKVNLRLNEEVEQRRIAEQEKENQRSEMEILYSLTVELASMPFEADLEGVVTTRLKQLTGAYIASISEYNPEKKQLELRYFKTESNAISEANRLLKRNISGLTFPVSDTMYKEMVNSVIGYKHNLSEVTFGSIPPSIGKILQNLFNLELFIGMAIQHEGVLIGSLMLIMQKDQAIPSKWLVSALANVLSIVYRRRQAEKERLYSENRFRNLTEMLPQAVYECDLSGFLTYTNRKGLEMFGFNHIEPGQNVTSLIVESQREQVRQKIRGIIDGKTDSQTEYLAQRKDRSTFPVIIYSTPIIQGNTMVGLRGLVVDITEIKLAEEALQESQSMLNAIVDSTSDLIWSVAPESYNLLTFNQGFKNYFLHNCSIQIVLGMGPEEILPEQDFIQSWSGFYRRALEEGAYSTEDFIFNGSAIFQLSFNLLKREGKVLGISVFAKNISESKQRERELQAIATLSSALRTAPTRTEMLPVIVEQVVNLIGCETVSIEIIDQETSDTVIEAAFGLWESLIGTRQKKGTGKNAIISKTQQIFITNDLENDPNIIYPTWSNIGIRGSAGAPLIAQDQLIGFIWIGLSKEITDTEIKLLSAISDITANAILRSSMHEQSLKAASDLVVAYDTTLEGWANALELREHETAGHSKRVVQFTVNLAKKFGICQEDTVHVQRGALLHDIGKMGIPDYILLKPGPLNEDEWQIMRQHPVYAKNLLSKIPYLVPALIIPYYHHERWDGSGYPLGLKKDEIPIEARIFSVVDVWDALSSDRPYRPAWTEEAIIQYMKDQAGKQFDPDVVSLFLPLIEENNK
jgi:PAS domain S-box-containing protein